jgi:hypothetical protein
MEEMNSIDVLKNITALFALCLALSLLVERFLEILKTVLDLVDDRLKGKRLWTRLSFKMKKRLESKVGVFEYVDPKHSTAAIMRFEHLLLGIQDGYTGTVPVISGDLLRAAAIKVACKLAGIGLGIGLAFWFGIDLVRVWQEAAGVDMSSTPFLSTPLRILASGIAIGLGSGPVHKIIKAIEKKRKKKEASHG